MGVRGGEGGGNDLWGGGGGGWDGGAVAWGGGVVWAHGGRAWRKVVRMVVGGIWRGWGEERYER